MPRVSMLRALKDGFFGGAEVLAHDGDDADVGEVAGGQGKVGCSAAEAALAAAGRGFNGIEGNAAYHGNGHAIPFLWANLLNDN